MAAQRYKKIILFILVLSYLFAGCQTKRSDMKEDHEITIGAKAPLFTLKDSEGKTFSLADHIGHKNLVIYFYPKDESYGCTKEACNFRDSYREFTDAGAVVIGISGDDEASHREFISHQKLPFILLSDPGRKVAREYGVGKSMGIIPGRVTFVVDKQGVIRGRYSSQSNYQGHVEEALKVIKSLK